MTRYTTNEYWQCLHEETGLDFDVQVSSRGQGKEVVRAVHNGTLVYEGSSAMDMQEFRRGIPPLLRVKSEERSVRLQLLELLQQMASMEDALENSPPLRNILERTTDEERVKEDAGSVLDAVQSLRYRLAEAILSVETPIFTIKRVLADLTKTA